MIKWIRKRYLIYKMRCNRDLKRNYYYMKYKGVIHDGVTEEFSMFSILYPLFIITGLSFFMWLLTRYSFVKEKIKEK